MYFWSILKYKLKINNLFSKVHCLKKMLLLFLCFLHKEKYCSEKNTWETISSSNFFFILQWSILETFSITYLEIFADVLCMIWCSSNVIRVLYEFTFLPEEYNNAYIASLYFSGKRVRNISNCLFEKKKQFFGQAKYWNCLFDITWLLKLKL